MTPRHGSPPERGRHYRIRPGVYAVLPLGAQMLLTHQAEPQPELQLPGGGIDPGESLWTALHREVMEETGWRVSDLRRFSAFQRFVYMPDYGYWARKSQAIYVGRAVRAIGPPTEDWHIPLWMRPADAVKHLSVEGDRVMVKAAMRRGLLRP